MAFLVGIVVFVVLVGVIAGVVVYKKKKATRDKNNIYPMW